MKKAKKVIKFTAANLCIAMITGRILTRILDYVNPNMDFDQKTKWMLYVFCVCAVILSIMVIFPGKRKKEEADEKTIKGNQKHIF